MQISPERETCLTYLSGIPIGPIVPLDDLVTALQRIWDGLIGADMTNMIGHKLDRLESPVWDPPFVRFRTERHARTVNPKNGSCPLA